MANPQAGTAECPRNYFEHASGFQRCENQSGPNYIQVHPSDCPNYLQEALQRL